MMPSVNLEILRKSRKAVRPGDIFAMKAPPGYLFGKVITIGASEEDGPMPGSCLVHVYDLVRDTKNVSPNELSVADLLIAPVFVHRLTWRDGYFETIENGSITQGDHDQNCFWDEFRSRYVDEKERVLEKPTRQCGSWGLSSLSHFDDLISDALGIPRAADDQRPDSEP